MSYIPADRQHEALVTSFNIRENIILETYYKKPFARKFSMNTGYIKQYAEKIISEYDIEAQNSLIPVGNLSGGNQQKVVIGRELSKHPGLLLIVQPTWGLDVSACEFVYKRILEERDKGVAIVLISTDLEEVRSLSDRMIVIFDGKEMGEVDPSITDVKDIGLMMAGSMRL